ncbi:hypothetical protein [Nocardia asteroides]
MSRVIDVIGAICDRCNGQGCRTCGHSGEIQIRITDQNIHHYL